MFMTGPRPRSRHQQRCVRDARRDATDIEFFISFYCITTIGQGLFEVCNIATGYAYKVFSKVLEDLIAHDKFALLEAIQLSLALASSARVRE